MFLFVLIQDSFQAFSEVPPLYSKPKPLPGQPPASEVVFRPAYQPPLPAAAVAQANSNSVPAPVPAVVPVAVAVAGGGGGGGAAVVAPADAGKTAAAVDDGVDPKMCIVCMERPKEVSREREINLLNAES